MKYQFLREHHNRQEKVWKQKGTGGYYGGPSAGGVAKVHEYVWDLDPSTSPPRPYQYHKYNETLDYREKKAELIAAFAKEARKLSLRIQGYSFSFYQNAQSFAQANQLPATHAARVFPKVKTEAEQRLATALNALRQSPFRIHSEGDHDLASMERERLAKGRTCIWLSFEGNVFGSIECERLWKI